MAVLHLHEDSLIIHAMRLRRNWRRYLGEEF